MVNAAAAFPGRMAVITGGEPLMHNLDALTAALHEAGFQTNIETSGSSPLSGEWDWICLLAQKIQVPPARNTASCPRTESGDL